VYQDYAPVQQVVVQRQIVAAPVYVQRQVVQQALVSPYVVRQQAVVGYGTQALAQANVGYGVANNIGVARGVRANGLGRQRAQKTVSRSKAVTVTRRPGLVNRVLGR
jgi:phage tail tape-measure protein